jgi:hypothetical protein
MRTHYLRLYLVLFCFLLTLGLSAQTWQQVVPGIDYRYYRFESPKNDVFVTRMDRSTTSTIIDGSIANGKISQPGVGYNAETIPAQATKYNGAFGFWGRETARYRYKVVAAINGSGFSTANGCPDSAMVMNGAMIKRTFGPTGAENGGMGFLYQLGSAAPSPGTPYMGEDLYLPPDQSKNCLSFSDNSRIQYHKINEQPDSDSIILYTHHYGARTPGTSGVMEIVVETQNDWPLRIRPWTNYVSGTAMEIKKNSTGLTPIPFDCIVIVVSGSFIDDVEAKIPSVGTEVRFSLETKDTSGLDWTNLYCGIGPMWGVMVRNGVKSSSTSPGFITDIHPRTAVAFNASYIYFIVVDGRSIRSSGMTLSALADFCMSELGATDAVNNDGGGSSTMWVDGVVKNAPSDGSPRAVANGLMMIQLQPKEVSGELLTGQVVYTNTPSTSLNVRSGPGLHFHALESLFHNTAITVQSHSLNGLRVQDVSGSPGYWWKVRTPSNLEGWVCAYYLYIPATGVENWEHYADN